MSARSIAVPRGTDTSLCIRPPYHSVVVAPAPLRADLDELLSQPNVIAMFLHDRGVTWPDRDGCRWATEYLAAGHPDRPAIRSPRRRACRTETPCGVGGGAMSRKKASAGRKRAIVLPKPNHRDIRAVSLDRVADLELTMGHVTIAERLSRLAAEIREAVR